MRIPPTATGSTLPVPLGPGTSLGGVGPSENFRWALFAGVGAYFPHGNFGNVFNHPNFGNPSANISSPATGATITSTLGNYLQGSPAARAIYVMLRLKF